MYKITAVVPNNKLRTLRESGDQSPVDIEGTTTVINTAKEGDANALRLIIGFCELVADGTVTSLTITKDDDNHTQPEV